MDRGQLGKLLQRRTCTTTRCRRRSMCPPTRRLVTSIRTTPSATRTGAKGVGEPATIPTAPAIANAVFTRHRRAADRRADEPGARARRARRATAAQGPEGEGVMLPSLRYVRPRSSPRRSTQLAEPGARVHAGGTDLIGCLRDGVFDGEARRQPRGPRRAARHRRRPRRRSAHRRADDDRRDRRARRDQGTRGRRSPRRPPSSPARSCATRARSAATSASGRGAGTSAASTTARGRAATCATRSTGENRYHAIFGGSGCFIVHPSDTAPALVALGASVRIQGPKGLASCRSRSSSSSRKGRHTRETVARRRRDGHRGPPARRRSRARRALPQGARARVVGLRAGRRRRSPCR